LRDLLQRGLLLCVAVCLISFSGGCREKAIKKSIEDAYATGHGEAAKAVEGKVTREFMLNEAYGYTKPYAPVIESPIIKKVWIPDHTTADNCLVSGHWVYIMIKDATWYIKDTTMPEKKIPVIIPSKGGYEGGKK